MIILEWKTIASKIKNELTEYFSDNKFSNNYLAILLLSDDVPSSVYVSMKKAFWEEIWLWVKIFWVNNIEEIDWSKLNSLENVINWIKYLNKDENCIWIIVQLPLPSYLMDYKNIILASIAPSKDVDGLWWVLMWLSAIDYIDFVPATPASVLNLLKYHNLDNYKGKRVTILGQSNLVGKPLAIELIKQWAEVFSFNHYIDVSYIKQIAKTSDYIISATWQLNLITDEFIRDDQSQILVDVGWWIIEWKAVWDIDYHSVKNKIYAITPVPGWVWPLTVACLFNNIKVIHDQLDKINSILS